MTHRATVSHQTVRLAPGNHASAEDGMCVMELASVLAGDQFGAFPSSVCPVIASFLRTYNDEVDDLRRQDLIRFAATVVGSRASSRVERRRARACRRWVIQVARPGFWRHPFWTLFAVRRRRRNESGAIYAALVAASGDGRGSLHQSALALVDQLLIDGRCRDALPVCEDLGIADHRRQAVPL